MPFRVAFDCLWCGRTHVCGSPDDLEGWAQLCPACVGRAGDNAFLRFRLRDALTERARATGRSVGAEPDAAAEPDEGAEPDADTVAYEGAEPDERAELDADMVAYYQARAPEYDDWYRRRGRYAHGPIHDAAWDAELDAAGRWLDGLPIAGDIVELAAGTGWWSPLLATKGELSLYDAAPAPLDRARERLVAHGLRAHIHLRDAWAEGDRPVDAVFTGFWLSHVPRDRLAAFLGVARRWLRPGGIFAFIDSMPDPASGAADHPAPARDESVRRLADGREFTIPKVYWQPAELEAALLAAGFSDARVTTTGRFFLTGVARL